MVSPDSGWVIEKNEAVLRTPGLLNSSPYGEGWLFKVKPHRLSAELHNMLTGKSAQQWQVFVRSQLGRFFSGTPALMYQDGGVMLTDLADRYDASGGRLSNLHFNIRSIGVPSVLVLSTTLAVPAVPPASWAQP